jgi:L-methionine (R)-S-oxide reductase
MKTSVSSDKDGRYSRIYTQLLDLLTKTTDPVAKMATIAALLHAKMDYFFWCGFYRMVNGELTVGPYQGPLACQVLEKNKGVCWAGVNLAETIIVPDVHLFPGHIACDSRSNSEIVVPLKDGTGSVCAILDVDSRDYNSFDQVDKEWLEKIVAMIQVA